MKYLFLIVFCLGLITIQAQNKVDAQFLYSYYNQDGDHGAVTGGKGSQELDFHGPSIVINALLDTNLSLQFNGGVDIYTSASTDKIDFEVSSASAIDARTHFSLGLTHSNEKKEQDIGYHASFSVESDYTSLGLGAFYLKGFKNYTSTFYAGLQVYFDDCRWGRLNANQDLMLVYPIELRDGTEWETEYLRQTYALSLSWSRLISKRLNGSIFIEPTLQNGLLATTFHRIYFQDVADSVAIEKLPYQRFKVPIGFRLNYFLTKKIVLRSYYRFYTDNWNITSHSAELEVPIKISPLFAVYPMYRYHVQTAAYWFKPYAQHLSNQSLFTSDYDLSSFTAHKIGFGLSWSPVKSQVNYQIRGGKYFRSDGLEAFFMSIVLDYKGN